MSMDLPPKLWLPPKPAIIRPAPVQKASFLPGMFPFIPAQSAAAALTTLSFRSSATSTAATIVGPADIVAGDLLVLLDRPVSKTTPTQVVPADFIVIDTQNTGASTRQVVSYKIADGSEASASLTGMDGSLADFKILAVFQGDTTISSVTVQDVSGEMTDGDPVAQSITASGGAVPLIVFGCYGGVAVNPTSWSGSTPSTLNNGTSLYLLYGIFNSSPADITIDMDDEGSQNCLQGFYLECS